MNLEIGLWSRWDGVDVLCHEDDMNFRARAEGCELNCAPQNLQGKILTPNETARAEGPWG